MARFRKECEEPSGRGLKRAEGKRRGRRRRGLEEIEDRLRKVGGRSEEKAPEEIERRGERQSPLSAFQYMAKAFEVGEGRRDSGRRGGWVALLGSAMGRSYARG